MLSSNRDKSLSSRGDEQQIQSAAAQAVEAVDVLLEEHKTGFERREAKVFHDAKDSPARIEMDRSAALTRQEARKKQNS